MDINNLPDDKDALKDIVADCHQQLIYLQKKLNFLQKTIYGSKSDKKPKCGSKETWPMLPGLVEMETEVETPQEIPSPYLHIPASNVAASPSPRICPERI